MKHNRKPIIAITIGDLNGIGPEIILKTFSDSRILDFCTPIIYGSMEVLMFYKKLLHMPDLALQKINSASELKKNKINVLDCLKDSIEVLPGRPTDIGGKLALAALDKAVEDILAEEVDALVTAPINKANLRKFSDGFTGHTGYLAAKDKNESLMILFSEKMKIAMATEHMALSEVKKSITIELLLHKIEMLNKCLISDFGIERPKIAVLGLNPHAGEDGLLGTEEKEVIIPAINQIKTKEIMALGPYSADGFFGSGGYLNFDGVLAMYHDQALIPFKTISFEDGVNFTAGLSFIRTSPDHGTAYEITGQRIASESSFRRALYAACDIFAMRTSSHDEIQGDTE